MKAQRGQIFGLLLMTASSTLYGISPLVVSSITETGIHYSHVMLFKGGIAAIQLLMVAVLLKKPLSLGAQDWRKVVSLGFLRGLTGTLLFGSYNWVTTGLATAIHHTYPLFVALLNLLLLHKFPTRGETGSLLFVLAGTICFVLNVGGRKVAWEGVVMALLSAIAFGAYLLTLDKSGLEHLPSTVYNMYELGCAAVFSVLFGLCLGKLPCVPNLRGWIYAAIAAAISCGCGVLTKIAFQYVHAQKVSVIGVLEPIVSMVMGALFLQEAVSTLTIVGMAMIIGSATITFISSRIPGQKK